MAITCEIILNIQNEEPRIIKLTAIGKYPYLTLSTTEIVFDPLLIGKQRTKEIEIKNSSSVQARFQITKI